MKTVLITGSSSGIGASCARLFSSNGYNVVINYNNSKENALDLCNELGPNAIVIKADVSKRLEVRDMIRLSKERFGQIDVLVNNAGISQQKLFTDLSDDDWNKMFDVNVKGVFNCCQEVIPDMIRRHSGNIINVSSMWGIVGASCEVHYSASKGAVQSLSKALAKELGPSNIRVNCVAPGVINTRMNSNLNDETISSLKEETPLGVVGEPNDIANLILFLASDQSKFITGQIISSNGGFVI